jgi:hypothetical protein
MRRLSISNPMEPMREWVSGPALISVGMSILFLGICLPGLPAVLGMSLVALGATQVTLTRFGGTCALVPVMLVHSMTYGGLYAVFVGSALHAVARSSAAGLGMTTLLDLAASTLPAAAAVRRIAVSLRSQFAA